MAKKVKLTEAQVKMLQNLETKKPRKILKISEAQYKRLFNNLNESSDYDPQSEKENEETFKVFNESISEDVNAVISIAEFIGEFKELIKHILTNPSQDGLSPFWLKLGVTWGDLIGVMSSMGLVSVTGIGVNQTVKMIEKSEFLRKLKIGGLKRLYNIFVEKRYDMKDGGKVVKQEEGISLGNDMELSEDGGYPAGAEHDSWAPWNTPDGESDDEIPTEYKIAAKKPLKLVWYNEDADGLAIFSYKDMLIAHVGSYDDASKMEEYCDVYNVTAECVDNYINDALVHKVIKLGRYNPEFYKNNVLTIVDDNVKQELLQNFGEYDGLANTLNGVQESDIEETTTAGSVGGSFVTPKIWAKNPKNIKFGQDPIYKQGKIVEDEPVGQSPKRGPKIKDDLDKKVNMLMKVLYKNYPELRNARTNLRFVLGDAFAQLALGINENSDKVGQIDFDDCTKLNNNKEAQNGGCSQGAVDNVVNIKESVYLEVAKKTGRSISEVKSIIKANFKK